MKFSTIHSGLFKLDGGAMFGVVPKQLWKKLNPPDDNNMCTWSMRCLLLEDGDRKILFDTGMGDKQGEKFRSHFEPHGPYDLIDSLEKAGVTASEITDVFITHYHFDHVGGAVKRDERCDLVATFENARYWSNQRHIDWATDPNHRERASFLKENFKPLEEHGVMNLLPSDDVMTSWLGNIDVLFVDGHTERMMIPHMAEKEAFLNKAVEENYILYLEHDAPTECITVTRNERGKFVIDKKGALNDFI